MRLEVKRRLYVSVVTVFTGALLLSPLFVMRYYEALSDEMFEACIAKLGFPSFDHCSQSTISAKLMSVWVLLIPYAPAILLLLILSTFC